MAAYKIKSLKPLSAQDVARFWEQVDKGDRGACWPWNGTRVWGYGQFGYGGIMTKSHRVAYFIARGVDPGALLVCHKCDFRPCCNPSHLFLGTHDDNMRDGVQKGVFPRGDRHRSKTHPELTLKGEKNPAAKLKEADIPLIRNLYAAGNITQYKLADMFSVNQRAIWQIIHRVKWKHVA